MIYLDYAASSPLFPEVIEKVSDISSICYGNPGAIHNAGAQARAVLQNSRFTLAKSISVRPEEIFFTSGGTESNNWAIKAGCTDPDRTHILCSATEHSSVLASLNRLSKKGYTITFLNPDRSGRIQPEAVRAAMGRNTALLCVQAVNNETGVLQDVDAMAEIAHTFGARYLCDAVQSFGHVPQNLYKADYISLSAHKFGGPRGVGCLIVRQPNRIPPLLDGGGQELSLRSGTENLPGIAGFALAAKLCTEKLPQEQARLRELTDFLETELRKAVPDLRVAGEGANRSSILCCAFPGISGEEMTVRLDLNGICVSPGAACAARHSKPSHVLRAMGYSDREAAGFVRFSPGRETTSQDIEQTVSAITDILRKRS